MEETLEVQQLIDSLEEIIPLGKKMKYLGKKVKFDFDKNTNPTKLDSWRGVYSELTLDNEIGGKELVLGDLIKDLINCTNGKIYHGYKGGEYRMNIDTPVYADPSGSYIERKIVGVKDTKDCILLLTLIENES